MSNLFNYIYEKKDKCNLLSGRLYGCCIIINDYYVDVSKYIYYDHKELNYILYDYKGGENVRVKEMKYNNIIYRFYKNNVENTYLEYSRMCDRICRGRNYVFTIYPNKDVSTLTNGDYWNVLMIYVINNSEISIMFNLDKGWSRASVQKHRPLIYTEF